MLRINRIKVKIFTDNGVYGFDTSFDSGCHFLRARKIPVEKVLFLRQCIIVWD